MTQARMYRRNFLAILLEGSFYFAGLAFVDANAVIPVFVFTYTANISLAGLATTIGAVIWVLMQAVIGPYVKRIRNVPRFITLVFFIFRPLFFLMLPFLYASLNPWLTAMSFFFLYAMIYAGDGIVSAAWTDFFGRSIRPDHRGRLLGYQQIIGGIGALAAGYIVKAVLDNPGLTDDQRYSIIFGSAALALTLSCIPMLFAQEPDRRPNLPRQNHVDYFRQLPGYLKANRPFARLIVVRMLASIASMVMPFVILFGQNQFRLDPQQVSTLIYIQIIGTLAGGVIWGRISSRLGNKLIIVLTQGLGFSIAFLSVVFYFLAPVSLPAFLLWPVVFANGCTMASWIGFINYTIEIVKEEDRTVYLLLSNLITFPFSFLYLVAGIMAQYLGYLSIFIISALAAMTALLVSRKLPQIKFHKEMIYHAEPS